MSHLRYSHNLLKHEEVMSKNSEIKSFENRYKEEIFEAAAITASIGVGAGQGR